MLTWEQFNALPVDWDSLSVEVTGAWANEVLDSQFDAATQTWTERVKVSLAVDLTPSRRGQSSDPVVLSPNDWSHLAIQGATSYLMPEEPEYEQIVYDEAEEDVSGRLASMEPGFPDELRADLIFVARRRGR